LIDTPGHVDFSYEVSRSIAACEGALLIVDATQGVQAQTISNLYMAIDNDLEIIPVINKVDLDSAKPEEVEDQIIELLGCKREEILRASGKTGIGVKDVLDAVVERVPAPTGDPDAPLQALIFDSVFNPFRGIIAYFKILNGKIKKNDFVKFVSTEKEYHADEVGVLKLDMVPCNEISAGNVGYIISGIKTSKEVKVGDTITHVDCPCDKAIEGFQEVKPMVFAGVYPIETEDYENLRASLEKLQLNDASLTFQPESSVALGFGFRCGFLGLLHMEIVQERLSREFNMDVITTVPNVSYRIFDKKGNMTEVHNPAGMPDLTLIDHIEEPYIRSSIITTTDYIGPIMTLCLGKRGELVKQEYISGNRVEIFFDIPLGEIVIDFYDKLKSISKGYASFDYHLHDYRPSKLIKLDILLNGESVDALSTLTHFDNAVSFGRRMCEKLKELIPRQQFDIAIQAAIGAKIIARETIKAVRKDVTAKCYGGDVSRKRKLLEKQKAGKKRMKQIGTVEVPQKAFLAVLKLD
jgi:GTP-binding protein LepA